jgi:hypothetical protein
MKPTATRIIEHVSIRWLIRSPFVLLLILSDISSR